MTKTVTKIAKNCNIPSYHNSEIQRPLELGRYPKQGDYKGVSPSRKLVYGTDLGGNFFCFDFIYTRPRVFGLQ